MNSYSDNPMYLFEHICRNHPEIEATWISGDSAVVERVQAAGFSACRRGSRAGIIRSLRAGVNVYGSAPDDTSFSATGGALNVNLYHGLPLKKIEFDIDIGIGRSVYHPSTFAERLRSHVVYAPKWSYQDVLSTTSPWAEAVFRRSYRDRVGEFVLNSSPRMTAALSRRTSETRDERTERLVALIRNHPGYVLLVAPTWRRYRFDIDEVLGNTHQLQSALADSNTLLVVKAHLATTENAQLGNLLLTAPNDSDITRLLIDVDGVITDYSSVAFDAALLGKPVIWAPVDRLRYEQTESNGFNLPYDTVVGHRMVTTPAELHRVIRDASWKSWFLPDEIVRTVWGGDPVEALSDGNERLVEAIKARLHR